MSEAAREWKVGDLVRLASGGPVMTVYDVHEVVCCAWFDRERFTHREGFHAAVLVPHQSAGFSEHVLTDAVMAELVDYFDGFETQLLRLSEAAWIALSILNRARAAVKKDGLAASIQGEGG